MKQAIKRLFMLLLLSSSLSAFAQKTDFSGNWKLDKTRTNFGDAPEWVLPPKIMIVEQADKLVLTRISLDQQLKEEAPITETLPLNGTPFLRTMPAGNTVTTTIHTQENGSLALIRVGTQTINEVWTLEDGGKTLVIAHQVKQANGLTFTVNAYYSKS